jgi:DNA-binding NarL/FixJ family response regulator
MSAKDNRTKRTGGIVPRRHQILLVEDHPLMREGIATWIAREPDLEVCCQAGSAAEALRILEKFMPDAVVLDVNLPGRSGLELLKDLKALYPQLRVLMLSMFDEDIYALRTLRAGAQGYVMQKSGGDQVVAALREILAGRRFFSPEVTAQIMDDFAGREHGHRSPLGALTDREFEIFQLLGNGRTNKEIARQLGISQKTVESHRLAVRHKLKIKSTPELIRRAVQYMQPESERTPAG